MSSDPQMTRSDLVFEHWKKCKIKLINEHGFDETLDLVQLTYILFRIAEEDSD